MANNRLYLLDPEANEYVCLAKGFGTWTVFDSELLEDFLCRHDFQGSTGGHTTLRLLDEYAELPEDALHWKVGMTPRFKGDPK